MKQAKGGGAGEKYWQENLKQPDPIKVDITQEQKRSKAHASACPALSEKEGLCRGTFRLKGGRFS